MTPGKRIFDLLLALVLVLALLPVMGLIAALIALCDGRPVLHRSERMKTPDDGFILWKFRSMRPSAEPDGATGGDKAARITPLGHTLRRSRLDELPQLFNILRGDMSFVGPRPPLRRHVKDHRNLYARVLRNRPGLTGLATLRFHRIEDRLLSVCRTAHETEQVYATRCIARKARLDLLWARHASLWFDLWLLVQTVSSLWLRPAVTRDKDRRISLRDRPSAAPPTAPARRRPG
ncbi:Sugar transferase involved in LPS biosynthesis (colanic, teichoic acid) [Roseovarius litoreus]|uniref:Sugar transferase involved in LPS biosynthesis (Colanic, teichoic acid) n=1 Tax=Roseovarius litoreus TaxID=1155722 RepID=A0A1M7GRI4_9RHOB|nr:sugar transferase [Roseovarius litoreus]SHM18932.1 Sugar transferase involved in LPS biosynthesis (colanic, teichoic acid) [Roseovarius litoreus]